MRCPSGLNLFCDRGLIELLEPLGGRRGSILSISSGKEGALKLWSLVLAALTAGFASTAASSETYRDDFSQPNGAPQGFLVFYRSVSVQHRALGLFGHPNG